MGKTRRFLIFSACCLALAACDTAGSKIGSTVKGTRIAIMEQTKVIEPDKDVQDVHPELNAIDGNAVWPQAAFDATHLMPNAALAAHPQKVWSVSLGEGSSSNFKLLARPAAAGAAVYTMDSQGLVRAFNAADGKRIWQFDTTPKDHDTDAIAGGIGADGDSVFVTTGFGEVLSLSATTGLPRWRHSLTNPVRAAPTIADGRVYATSIDNQLTALSEATGEEQWHHNGIAETATLMGASNPAAQGNAVVVAYSSGEIYQLRAENGRVAWTYALMSPAKGGDLPAIADIRGLPIIDHDRVFAISHSGRIAAIDTRTGDRAWESDIGGINTPVIGSNAVFILSNDGQLVALTRDAGRVIWVKTLQKTEDPKDKDSDPIYWVGPVAAGDRLWLTNSLGQLVSFAPADGKQQDSIDIGAPVFVPPVIAGKTMYVVTDDGDLIALR